MATLPISRKDLSFSHYPFWSFFLVLILIYFKNLLCLSFGSLQKHSSFKPPNHRMEDFAISLMGQRKHFAILGVSRLGSLPQVCPRLSSTVLDVAGLAVKCLFILWWWWLQTHILLTSFKVHCQQWPRAYGLLPLQQMLAQQWHWMHTIKNWSSVVSSSGEIRAVPSRPSFLHWWIYGRRYFNMLRTWIWFISFFKKDSFCFSITCVCMYVRGLVCT